MAHFGVGSPAREKWKTCRMRVFFRGLLIFVGTYSNASKGVFGHLFGCRSRYVNCSQDQWDIYKLDPRYDCFVKYPPALTVISMKDNPYPRAESGSSSSLLDDDELEPMIVDNDPTPFNPDPPRKKARRAPKTPTPHQFNFTSPSPNLPEERTPKKRGNVYNPF